MTNTQYFTETVSSSAQTISDSTPMTDSVETLPPDDSRTVCMV